jgi:hypothetical protein
MAGQMATKKPRSRRGSTAKLTSLIRYARESNDTPRLNAIWRVAPGLRFNAFAILPAGVFFLADAFSSRTSAAVQARRFDFFAILISFVERRAL